MGNSKTAFFKAMTRIVLFGLFGVFMTSCATEYSAKMYSDVIGFNDTVYQSYMPPPKNPRDTDTVKPIPGILTDEGNPYNLLNQSQGERLQEAIDNIPSGQNTAALYALDLGLDRVALVNRRFMERDPNSKYYIVFFTDGIDNASVSLAARARRGRYPLGTDGRDAYGEAMRNRMTRILPTTTNTFQSYVLLYKGQDLESYQGDQLRACSH